MNSLKQNYDKHLIVTVIVLVGLPILLVYSTFTLINISYQNQIITFFINYFNDPDIGIGIANQFFGSFGILQYVIFVVMLILYPVYPFIFSIEKHLSKRNPKSALTEYEAQKKIFYALVPLFVFTIALRISSGLVISGIIQDDPLSNLVLSLAEPAQSLLLSILAAILLAGTSTLIRIILLNRSKYFKFYLARLSFRAMSRVNDEVERMKYLIGGLGFYNKYIRRALGLEINDLKMIYSKIIADAAVDKKYSMKELCSAFEDNDKLRPIRCLTGLFNVEDPAHFLTKEAAGKKLQESVIKALGLASTIAGLLATVLPYVLRVSS
jgi:hypothetical protein